ncbi:unnamed protein product, partial [Onchocerca ochengi]|uniref:DUF3699 domain-containing protein n=1 Tax=Onchocerca ochengi TaxID=42157 RepID=A0A182ETE6_ONCOC
TREIIDESSQLEYDLHNLVGGIGICLLKFFKFLSSRTMQTLKMLNFRNIGYRSLLIRGQWIQLNKFGTIEVESFMIELPIESPLHLAKFREKVHKHSGVKYLQMRQFTHRKKEDELDYSKFTDRIIVSAVGTLDSLHRLRDLLSVRPSVNPFANYKESSDMISRLILERLEKLN